MKLRSWLRKNPPAFAVRCDTDSGSKTVDIDAKDPRRWARTEETILSLRPSFIEAVSKTGNVLRTQPIEWADDDAADDDDAKKKKKLTDIEALLATFAGHLAAAYKQGASDHHDAFKASFDMMVDVTKATSAAQIASTKALALAERQLRARGETPPASDEDDSLPAFFVKAAVERMVGKVPGAKAAADAGGAVDIGGVDPSTFSDDQLQEALDGITAVLKSRKATKPNGVNGHAKGAKS